jgi:hypothetical protein
MHPHVSHHNFYANSSILDGREMEELHYKQGSCMSNMVRETLELNQLKSAVSQFLPVFSGFDWLQTCCH